MNVKNCRSCGRLFNYVLGPVICPRCKDEREALFQEVKKYVEEHKGADIMEVSEECNVEPNQIRQWIREERLQFAEDSPIQIACESCGTMIRSGRFCDKCKAEMTNGFRDIVKKNQAAKEPPKPQSTRSTSDRMRYL